MAWYNEVANKFMDYIANPINEGIKSWLGVSADERAKESLAIQNEAQQFNEQFSKEQLKQQAEQFSKSNATALKNIAMQEDVAKQNLAFQQDAFNRQLAENQLTREREDTAYQRQIADLKAAGFSPLMASNGASATGMSVGSAPQLDYSGVATAQGSQLALAQEYASLKNMAEGQYLTRRQEIVNSRSSALNVLSDISKQRQAQAQNLALQSFNMALQLKELKQKDRQLDLDMEYKKELLDYNKSHGFRNENLQNYLVSVLDNLMTPSEMASTISTLIDKALTSTESLITAVNSMTNIPNSMKEQVVEEVKQTANDIKSGVYNSMYKTFYPNEMFKEAQKDMDLREAVYSLNEEKTKTYLGKFYDSHKDWFGNKMYKWQFQNISKKQLLSFWINPAKFLENW